VDEVEWWEFDSLAEMAAQASGDIGFVIERAIEAHGGARIALPGEEGLESVFSELVKRKDIDWTKVTLIPTDDRLVGEDDRRSGYRRLNDFFGAKGATIVRLVDPAALGDAAEAGKLADARLAALDWPLDLACLGMAADGHTAGILPGPDLDRALSGPRERRAVTVRPDPAPEGDAMPRVTLTAAALSSARAVMVLIAGDERKDLLERALKEGPLSSLPIGRLVSSVDAPIDIFWSSEA
jgi:6-phosphogluconolactonase